MPYHPAVARRKQRAELRELAGTQQAPNGEAQHAAGSQPEDPETVAGEPASEVPGP